MLSSHRLSHPSFLLQWDKNHRSFQALLQPKLPFLSDPSVELPTYPRLSDASRASMHQSIVLQDFLFSLIHSSKSSHSSRSATTQHNVANTKAIPHGSFILIRPRELSRLTCIIRPISNRRVRRFSPSAAHRSLLWPVTKPGVVEEVWMKSLRCISPCQACGTVPPYHPLCANHDACGLGLGQYGPIRLGVASAGSSFQKQGSRTIRSRLRTSPSVRNRLSTSPAGQRGIAVQEENMVL